jgi:hypothetical protein
MTTPENVTRTHRENRPNVEVSDAFGAPDRSILPEEKAAPRSSAEVNDSTAMVCYSNFCRVIGTPEELVLDFGLNAQPAETTAEIEIKQRLVVSYFTAKRLLHALALSVQRHEGAFGVLETDISQRISSAVRRSQAIG